MIRSMTAFAACERATDGGPLGCELRAVNHRFLELGVRAAGGIARRGSRNSANGWRRRFRAARSTSIAPALGRARSAALSLNDGAAGAAGASWHAQLTRSFPSMRVEFTDLLRYPACCSRGQASTRQRCSAEAMALLDEALDEFVAARGREGANLAAVMRERLDGIERDRRAGARVAAGDPRGAARQAGTASSPI